MTSNLGRFKEAGREVDSQEQDGWLTKPKETEQKQEYESMALEATTTAESLMPAAYWIKSIYV